MAETKIEDEADDGKRQPNFSSLIRYFRSFESLLYERCMLQIHINSFRLIHSNASNIAFAR